MPIAKLARVLLFAIPFVSAACQSEQAQRPAQPSSPVGARAEISNEFTATAQVVALAPEERVVTLRREDGSLFDVQCGDAVRNFDQITVGDELRVRYKEVLAAAKLSATEAAAPAAQGAIAAARAKPGAKPGAGVTVGFSVRVRIESIDREHDIVVFSLASGELIARRIRTPEGRGFVKELAVGDQVQLGYVEALALTIEDV